MLVLKMEVLHSSRQYHWKMH